MREVFRLTAKEATALALFLESKKQRMAIAGGASVDLEFRGNDAEGFLFLARCEDRESDLTDYTVLEGLAKDYE